MNQVKSPDNERVVIFDYIKISIIILVIYGHAQYILVDKENGEPLYRSLLNFTILFKVFARQTLLCAVPFFLFISGYLMSKKTIKTKSDYINYQKKQIPKVFIPLLVWSIIYSVYSLFYVGESIGLVVKKFVYFQAAVQFYFILLIIQYYLLQPLIIQLAKNIKTLLIAFSISILMCLLIEYLVYVLNFGIPLSLYAGNFLPWLIFPVLGAFVQIHNPKLKPATWLICTLLLLAISFAHSIYALINYKQLGGAITGLRITTFSYSVAIILYIVSIKEKFTSNKPLIETIAGMVFGIFFVHLLYLRILQDLIGRLYGKAFLENIFGEILITFVVLLLSFATGKLLIRINKQISAKYFGF